MNNSDGLSVLICSHNGGKLIGETLRHLAQQEFTQPIAWEVVLVDNASTDDLTSIARTNWKIGIPLKIVSESRKGTAYARITGIQNCRYEYISFIDDDNWVPKNWVESAYFSILSKPDACAVGSRSKPVFGAQEPKWFSTYMQSYAVGQQYPTSGKIEKLDGLVWGAGMIMRKQACDQLIEAGFEPLLVPHKNEPRMSGNESELLLLMKMCGWEIYNDNLLVIEHYMTPNRLKWPYFLKLKESHGVAKVYLDLYRKLLAWVCLGQPLEKVHWQALTRSTLAKILKDPAAILANMTGSAFEGNYRVALYHFYLGELRERLRLRRQLESIQRELIQNIQRYPLAWKDGRSKND